MNETNHTFRSPTVKERFKAMSYAAVISCTKIWKIDNVAKVSLLAVLSLISLQAVSQPHQQACADVDSTAMHEELRTLFRYSQLAERPDDRTTESTSCSDVSSPTARALGIPFDLFNDQKGPFDKNLIENEAKGLLEKQGRSQDIQVSLEGVPKKGVISTVHASCKVYDSFWSVAIRLYEISNNLFFEADVAAKKSQGTAWLPIQIDGPPPIIRFAGTELSDPKQWVTNFVGEECIFPAATFTMESICKTYRESQLVFVDTDESFHATENGTTTLVGHSLGGAAVQYISHFAPLGDCGKFKSYAFGSIGLTDLSENISTNESLQTYISQCDWLARMLFHDNKQAGNVISMESDEHAIDGIQDDICACITRDEQLRLVDDHHTAFTEPPTITQLGNQQCATWHER